MADTQPLAPTDAEIVALADATRTAEGGANGYILPISFAHAVLDKWGAQPRRNQTPAFFTVFAKWNEDEVPLAHYSASSENGVLERVREAAQREGYKGLVKDRMTELGWRIGPVYAEPLPVKHEPLTDEQVESLITTKHFREGYKLASSDRTCLAWYRFGLRDGERAHGITGGHHE